MLISHQMRSQVMYNNSQGLNHSVSSHCASSRETNQYYPMSKYVHLIFASSYSSSPDAERSILDHAGRAGTLRGRYPDAPISTLEGLLGDISTQRYPDAPISTLDKTKVSVCTPISDRVGIYFEGPNSDISVSAAPRNEDASAKGL